MFCYSKHTYCFQSDTFLFCLGVSSDPTEAEDVNTAAFIAGGLVAFIGLLVITAIIIFILKKKQKVCFKVNQARFPFFTARSSLNNARALSYHDAVTSISCNNLYAMHPPATKHDVVHTDTDACESLTRQFLTDGQEKSVRFNYKVTLHSCDPKDDVIEPTNNGKLDGLIV